MDNTPDMARRAEAISLDIRPALAGQHPAVQSAVIADLLAIWLAGFHPPEARVPMLADHIRLVLRLLHPRDEDDAADALEDLADNLAHGMAYLDAP